MSGLLYLLAFGAGVVLIVQVGLNNTVRGALDSPLSAALVSFLVGSLTLAALLLATRTAWPVRAQWQAVPAWAWFGGVLGVYYIVSSIIAGPRLGAAVLLALIVLGQLLTSLLVDHYGWLGFPRHPLTVWRAGGAVLLFLGVLLISR
ncbi:MAG: DMT family transporter [Gammaproteobacteria bacterium]|nr:DMT family transporter [Gammaproteobacteria bacterium]